MIFLGYARLRVDFRLAERALTGRLRSRSSSIWRLSRSTQSAGRCCGCSSRGGRSSSSTRTRARSNARRPWLPSVAVKWIDERRGRWMYRDRDRVRERWFRPWQLARRLRRWFPEVQVRHLLSRDEEGRFPFESVPAARLLVLWAAKSAGRTAVSELIHASIGFASAALVEDARRGSRWSSRRRGCRSRRSRALIPCRFEVADSSFSTARTAAASSIRPLLEPAHVLIDVDQFRRGEVPDPFAALVDDRAGYASWAFGGFTVSERVARYPKGLIRRRLIGRLRDAVIKAGGVWMRISPFPYPYQSAFSFRADLDESVPEDYHRFAAARGRLGSCSTHFVSTYAYTHERSVLNDLRRHDTQSHGHFHHVYREPRIESDESRAGAQDPVQLGDRAGRVRRTTRPMAARASTNSSRTWAISTHPTFRSATTIFRFTRGGAIASRECCRSRCTRYVRGCSWTQGVRDPELIAEYFRQVVSSRLDAGELTVIYGHPERRLGRMPEIMRAIAEAVRRPASGLARVVFRAGAVVALAGGAEDGL